MLESIPPERSAPGGHVRDEPLAHGDEDGLADRLEPFVLVAGVGRARLELPVTLDPDRVVLGDEEAAGLEPIDALGGGPLPRHVAEREVGVEPLEADPTPDAGKGEQGLQLGGERERAVAEARPEERFLAEAVAREEQPLPARVPERDREHAVEVVDEPVAVLLVEMRDRRRVAGATEPMSLLLQLLPEPTEVVQLAVEDGHDAAVLVGNRLVARREVDHAEPAVPEGAPPPLADGAVVGAAMTNRIGGGAHLSSLYGSRSSRAQESTDPAHLANGTAVVGAAAADRLERVRIGSYNGDARGHRTRRLAAAARPDPSSPRGW